MLITVLIAVGAAVLILLGITIFLYQKVFQRRYEMGDKPFGLSIEDFPSLTGRPVIFHVGNESIRGSFYKSARQFDKGKPLVIYMHGLSNGSRDYLPQIHCLAEHGYEVFSYDNIGCHRSTGRGIGGLPQGVITLSYLLDMLVTHKDYEAYHNRPIILMGHSWGGYCVNTVLNFMDTRNIRAVVSFSAPGRSLDMLMERGRDIAGRAIHVLKPFLWLLEYIKFGKYAAASSIDGINRTKAYVLVIHSRDDGVVSLRNSAAGCKKMCTNNNAEFLIVDKKGHNLLLSAQAREYAFQWKQKAGNIQGLAPKELEKKVEDVDKLRFYQLDQEMMDLVIEFCRTAMEKKY